VPLEPGTAWNPERPEGGRQVWLDPGDPRGGGPDAVDAFLAAVSAGPEPPLVVLVRDDAPGCARTQRLAVDRPGQTLLVRDGGDGRAYALGQPPLIRALAEAGGWPLLPPAPGPARSGGRLLVLDVDGVLIDPGRAFLEAVAGALGELAPGLAWSDQHFLGFKRAGSFNNDFRLVAGALALAEQDPSGRLGPQAVAGGHPGLEARIQALEPRCRPVVRKHYGRTRRLERALVTRAQLAAFPGDLAIFTGRPPQELGFAFEVLGFNLTAVADSAPHLRKPKPAGLIQLADAFRAERITFVGDSRDDAAALAAARTLRPGLDWRFGAVGPDRDRFRAEGDLHAATLIDLLETGGLG
jgi:phosphoglycolate phosphatase-like HAD superfamily hydrolase